MGSKIRTISKVFSSPEQLSSSNWAGLPLWPVGLAAFGLFGSLAMLHVHDADAMLYTVLSRHLAEDGTPFHLRLLPQLWPSFYEHPPFFFWIWALLLKVVPEPALSWTGVACGMGTFALLLLLGSRLLSRQAALWGGVLLLLCEIFSRYQSLPRLDPPLTLAFTASVVTLVLARGRLWLLGLGGLFAGLGALIKGPPALGGLVAAGLFLLCLRETSDLRRPSRWVLVISCALILPVSFLLYDHWALQGVWWRGYVEQQVLASLIGHRHDTSARATYPGFLLVDVMGRFWHGLPFLGYALWQAARHPNEPISRARWGLLAWSGVVIAGFSLPGRVYSYYAMPAYPPLALLAGSGIAEFFSRKHWKRPTVWMTRACAILGTLLVVLLPLRLATLQQHKGADLLGDIPDRIGLLLTETGPTTIAVFPHHLRLVSAAVLVEHLHVNVIPVENVQELRALPAIKIALVSDAAGELPPGWREETRVREWRLARRIQ